MSNTMKRLVACVALLLPGLTAAQPGPRVTNPIVVELFTSQGCSSCPPADAFLTDLAHTRPDVLALAFHVTYWNRLGWPDPYSLPAATERQRAYAQARADRQVFTPEMVVQGQGGLVGSDRDAVMRAIALVASHPTPAPTVAVRHEGDGMVVEVGAGEGAAAILVVGYDTRHSTQVGRGENAGRTLTESNIVRDLTVLGTWSGGPVRLRGALPAGEQTAVLLQAGDGRILAAARL